MMKILLCLMVFNCSLELLAQSCSQSPIVAKATNTILSPGQSSTLNYTGCIGGKVVWTSGTANTIISNTTVSPTTTTSYKATCTFSATNTCNSSVNITVLPTCNITASITKNTINEGETISLSHTGCVGGAISWRDADGTSITNPAVSPKKTTSYSVLCAYDNGQSCVSSIGVSVTPKCVIEAFATESTITLGEASTLSSTGCVGGTISWLQGTTTITNLTVSPLLTTNYTAKCTYANGSNCTDDIQINVIPTCAISPIATTQSIKAGSSSTLSHTGCVGGQVTWRNQQNNLISNLTVNPIETSTYKVSCAYNTGNICNSEITIAVVPNICDITAMASQPTIQSGQSSILYSSGCTNGIVTWKQSTTLLGSLVVKPTNTTIYTATCTYSDNTTCTSNTTITVSSPTICGLVASASNFAVMVGSSQTSTVLSTLSTTGCTTTPTWKAGSTSITNLTVSPTITTTYTATCATGATTTCTSSVTVFVYQACAITAKVVDTAISSGQKTSLSYTGCENGQVKWQDATNIDLTSLLIAPIATTSYKVTCSFAGVSAANSTCNSTIAVAVYPTCNIIVKASKQTIVSGSATTLSATGCTNGTIKWFSGNNEISNPTVSPTVNTTYKATCSYGTNTSVCESSVLINVLPICTIAAVSNKTTVVAGESITLSNTGCQNGTVFWKNAIGNLINELTFEPAETQIYTATCTYKGISSCTSTVSVTVNYSITIGNVISTKPSCGSGNNATLTVPLNRTIGGSEKTIKLTLTLGTATIGTFYTINSSFAEIKNLKAGAYVLKVETLDGATVKATTNSNFTITDGAAITFTNSIIDVKCFGGADGEVKITASGGVSPYYYDFDNLNIFNVFDATSILTLKKQKKLAVTAIIKDANGCLSDSKPVEVKQPATALVATITSQVNPLGFETKDGQATVSITGGTPGYSFAWTDEKNVSYGTGVTTGATNKNSILRGGTYTVKVFDKNYSTSKDSAGCTTFKTVKLVEPPQLKILFTAEKPASCADRADGRFSVVLSGGVPFDTGLPYKFTIKHKTIAYEDADKLVYNHVPGGVYVMKITDQNNISRTLEYTLPSPSAIMPKVVKIKNLTCFNDKTGGFELDITGGKGPYSAIWNNKLTGLKLSNLSAGKYIGLVTDSLQCEVLVLAEINQPQKLEIKYNAIKPVCADSCIGKLSATILGGTLPYTYSWDDPTNKTLSLSKLCHNSSQTLTVKDKNECLVKNTNKFDLLEKLVIPLTTDKIVCNNAEIWLDATTPKAKNYEWVTPNGKIVDKTSFATNLVGAYTLTIKDSANCAFTKKILIKTSEFVAPKAFFTGPSEVGKTQNFILVNLLNPLPNTSDWVLPTEAKIKSKSPLGASLVIDKIGEYTLGLQANYAGCQAYKSAKLKVVEVAEEVLSVNLVKENVIVKVGENPNNGQFKVGVEFEKNTPFTMEIRDTNPNSNLLYHQQVIGNLVNEVNIDLGNINTSTLIMTIKTANTIITKKILIVN